MGKRHDPSSIRSTKRPSSNLSVISKGRAKTRSDKPKLIQDPDREEQVLSLQLRENGLYAANILGDGNCLFRALSDQLFGSPSQHLQLRNQICDFLASESEQERFKVFVDLDDYKGGWSGYVREMRQPGTYGTNIELSAFVHLYQRSIKIFQPGLVYVMQPEPSTTRSSSSSPSTSNTPLPSLPPSMTEDNGKSLSAREKRLKVREEKNKVKESSLKGSTPKDKGKGKGKEASSIEASTTNEKSEKKEEEGPLCIVYHSWEHYSSLRNLKGPHTGPPRLRIARPVSPSLVEHPSASASASPPRALSPPTPDEPSPRLERSEDVTMSSPPESTRSSKPSPRRSSLRNTSVLPPLPCEPPPNPSTSSSNTRPLRTYSRKDRSKPLHSTSSEPPSNKRDRTLLHNSTTLDTAEDEYLSSGQHRGQSPALTNSSSSTSTSTSTTTTTANSTESAESSTTSTSTSLSHQQQEEEKQKPSPASAATVEEEETDDSDSESLSIQNLLRPYPNHLKPLPLPPSSSSVSPEKPTRGGGGGVRGPTGREKKELARVRRMERRRIVNKGSSDGKEEEGRVLRSGKRIGKGEEEEEEEGLGGKVRELYI